MDEAENVFVSRHREWLAGGQTDHRQNALGRLPGGGKTGRHHQTRSPAFTETQLRNPFARERCRSTHTASPPRSRRSKAVLHLSTPVGTSSQSGRHTTRQGQTLQPRPGEPVAEVAQKMKRPPIEVADIIRAVGKIFID